MSHFGIIVLNKPKGISSRTAINTVQRLARPAKVGHAGTLDPLASGVLVTCVGPATRLIGNIQQMPKGYRATFLLGRESPTEDTDGEVQLLEHAPIPTREQIQTAAERLTGRIMQRPPAFSALKVAGRRAYDLARKGQDVELQPRPIDVYRFHIARYDYPELVMNIDCGSGTYVRSLGRDLAESINTASVMSDLVRTRIGCFSIDQAVEPGELNAESWTECLLSPVLALGDMARVTLDDASIAELQCGRAITLSQVSKASGDSGEKAVLNSQGRLVSIIECRFADNWSPKRNFPVP